MDENQPSNVVKFEARGRKAKQIAEYYAAIADAINGEPFSLLPPFPQKMHVIDRGLGNYQIVEEHDRGVCSVVTMERAVHHIVQYTSRQLSKHKGYRWDYDQCRKAVKFWMSSTDSKEVPWPVLELSQPGLCFHRLPFDAPDDQPHEAPLFSEFLRRVRSNQQQLVEWIGSLFYPDSDRQQYVWMYGGGGNGKGAIVRLLSQVMGSQLSSENAEHASGRFWTHGLLDKRLVVFPDCNHSGFPATGLFKQLTGDDPVRVEPKGYGSYTARISAKFLFLSNQKPAISSQESDMRRAIYCDIAPVDQYFKDYEAELWKEAPAIIGSCKWAYREVMSRQGKIIPDRGELDLIVEEFESPYAAFYAEHFRAPQGTEIGEVAAIDMQNALREDKITDPREQKKYIEWMERTKGVHKKKKKHGLVYCGVLKKPYSERR